jgi:NADP-dependent aldehyde dehydrogenase
MTTDTETTASPAHSDGRSVTVDEAVTAAAAASSAVAKASYEQRASWLEALADMLDANADELVPLADAETHLGSPRLPGELARTSAQLRLFAGVVREGRFLEATIDHRDDAATPPIPDLRRMLVPVGPVAVFAASNFPFAFSVLGGDTASALAAGNPVVVKAHEGHPRLSRRVIELSHEALADAPRGLLELVEGGDASVALVEDPRIMAVGFTGSVRGGRYLFDVASRRERPIPFYGELGSLNPVIVTPGAASTRADEVAEGLAGSFTMGAGQFCTKPGVVFIPASSDLDSRLASHVNADDRFVMLNERIAAGFRDRLAEVTGVAAVRVVTGRDAAEADLVDVSEHGDHGGSADSALVAGPIVLATTIDTVLAEPTVLLDEVFGPVTLLVRYDDLDQVNDALRAAPGTLTTTIHAEDGEDVGRLLDEMAQVSGRVLYGGWPTGVAVSWAQQHGGPYPASTSLHTSVGATAIRRFLRPVAYQTVPDALLPEPLQEANPLAIPRRVDGQPA